MNLADQYLSDPEGITLAEIVLVMADHWECTYGEAEHLMRRKAEDREQDFNTMAHEFYGIVRIGGGVY